MAATGALVSPPTERERLAALARLTGPSTEALPPEGAERDALALRLIGDAHRAGVTWAAIGEAICAGLGPKLAKRETRLLAKAVAAGRRYAWPEQPPS